MERVLEGAVEHGVDESCAIGCRRSCADGELLIRRTPDVRGFRLEGYGVFFDVIVPSLDTTSLTWSVRTLDQNDLGLRARSACCKTRINALGRSTCSRRCGASSCRWTRPWPRSPP